MKWKDLRNKINHILKANSKNEKEWNQEDSIQPDLHK